MTYMHTVCCIFCLFTQNCRTTHYNLGRPTDILFNCLADRPDSGVKEKLAPYTPHAKRHLELRTGEYRSLMIHRTQLRPCQTRSSSRRGDDTNKMARNRLLQRSVAGMTFQHKPVKLGASLRHRSSFHPRDRQLLQVYIR